MDRDYWFRAKGICGKEIVMAKETQSASTNTIRLHRVLRAAPEKVYRAFLDAEAMAKWLPPNGYTQRSFRVNDGILADVAPTLLFLLGLEKPYEMSGQNLLVPKRIRQSTRTVDPEFISS